MARWGRIHEEQVKVELRMERAFLRSVERVRERISINDVAMAIANGSLRQAAALIEAAMVEDSLEPSATIAEDAFIRGGKVGAQTVTEALKLSD